MSGLVPNPLARLVDVFLSQTGGVAYVGMLWGITLGDWFARMMKSQTLMVSQLRAGYGY
jgi:hypothetical protein